MRFGLYKTALLIGAAAIMTPAAVMAQDTQTVAGTINSAPETFTASVPAGSVMTIDVISTSDLDPIVAVRDASTNQLLAENDDGGDGYNSRVRIPGGETGLDLVIEVNSFDAAFAMEGEDFGGSFNLVMTTVGYVPPGPVTYGSSVMGSYTGDPVLYSFAAQAGDRIEVELVSEGFLDPYLELRDSSGATIAFDDDGLGDLNSLLRHSFDEAGTYTIAALGYADSTGDYTLNVRERREPAGPVAYGSTVRGTLSGSPEEHPFTAQAGDMIEVALLSDGELDPYLEIRNRSGETIAFNDDGGQGLNSLLRHTFDEAGTYMITAMGFADNNNGDYTLRVRDRRDPPAPQLPLQVIALNDIASGELTSEWEPSDLMPATIDYQLSEDAKRAIRAGNGHITIRMNAAEGGDPDFMMQIDPFIQVGFETPLGFAVAMTDDNGSGTMNALLPMDLGLLDDHDNLLDMLRIRVQGMYGSAGEYTLVITEGMEQRVEPTEMYDDIMFEVPPPAPPPAPPSPRSN